MTQKLTAHFIGCGKLGKTMAALFQKTQLIEVLSVVNRSQDTAQKAIEFIQAGKPSTNFLKLEAADCYFIATPDDQISVVCDEIINSNTLLPNSIFIHFSGSLSSEALSSAQKIGCHIGSLHPMRSFADPHTSVENFAGTYCSYEGSEAGYHLMNLLISKCCGKLIQIQKQDKTAYHAGAVFASNYCVTLAECARTCYEMAGIPWDISKEIILSFMQGTLENISVKNNLAQALTGPIQRGDVKTVQKHIEALESSPVLKSIYLNMAKMTLELTSHSQNKKEKILELF